MFNQDERKIECAFGNREICVLQGKKAEIVLILCISDVGICGIYLSLALGTAKFKKLDWFFFFFFLKAPKDRNHFYAYTAVQTYHYYKKILASFIRPVAYTPTFLPTFEIRLKSRPRCPHFRQYRISFEIIIYI